MKYFVLGGAGFIGSEYINRIVSLNPDDEIIAYDNLSSTHSWKYLDWAVKNGKVRCVLGDAKDISFMMSYMKDVDLVAHFASNPDISKAVSDPMIDFRQGTYLTQNVVEAMRLMGIKKIIYASGSGVYGDAKETYLKEDYSPMIPVSTYGASKLAGEVLISSYCYMFGLLGRVYRFANVVGGNSTHGVTLSFVNKLIANPKKLEILGNGKQSKSYIYVEDILSGILKTAFVVDTNYDVFNVATQDYIEVKEIADIVVEEMGLKNVEYIYTSSETKGWVGDVGISRFNTDKIRSYGWNNKYTTREAIILSTRQILNKICLERSL